MQNVTRIPQGSVQRRITGSNIMSSVSRYYYKRESKTPYEVHPSHNYDLLYPAQHL